MVPGVLKILLMTHKQTLPAKIEFEFSDIFHIFRCLSDTVTPTISCSLDRTDTEAQTGQQQVLSVALEIEFTLCDYKC